MKYLVAILLAAFALAPLCASANDVAPAQIDHASRLDFVFIANGNDHTNAQVRYGLGWQAVQFKIAGRQFHVDTDYAGGNICQRVETAPVGKKDDRSSGCTFRPFPYLGVSTNLTGTGSTTLGADFRIKSGAGKEANITLHFRI